MREILSPAAESGRRWTLVNDGVMGGRSSSRADRTGDGALRFHGFVSLENNGGFASTRTEIETLDLSAFRGVALRVRGDGRRYQIRLRMDPRDPVAYKAEFATDPGEWTEVRLPFAAFQPTFRGRRPPDAPPLDPGTIGQVGLLIADGKEGPFELELAWVQAYGSPDSGRGQAAGSSPAGPTPAVDPPSQPAGS